MDFAAAFASLQASPPRLYRPTLAIVDLGAIAGNFQAMRRLVKPGAFFCPMVKANAYGHGDREVARTLRRAGATHLGVATIEEALGLREGGETQPLLVFGLFDDASAARAIIDNDLTPVISTWAQLAALEQAPGATNGVRVSLHLKFNTGMNRLGFVVSDAPKLRSWLESHTRFHLDGVCTHLLRGDDAAESAGDTSAQFAAFGRVLEAFRGMRFSAHAMNSAASAAFAESSFFDSAAFGPLGARPGIAIYGSQPSNRPDVRAEVRPALALGSRIVAVNRLQAGEVVSYGGTWRATRASRIGVVPVGYADGYLRALSNRGVVLCRGRRVPVVGTVCMDYFMVDLTDVASSGESDLRGEEVVLIGRQGQEEITADELASRIGTISYEIFTRIGSRVPRVYVGREPS